MSLGMDAIGLGVTIALYDAFTRTGNAIISKFREMEKTIDGGTGRVKLALEQMEQGMAVAGVGAGILFALDKAVDRASKYSAAVAEVSTLVDESAVSTKQIRDATLGLNDVYGGGAAGQAKGLYQTISAGITDAAKAVDLMDTSNRLAVGGVTDVKTAVDGLTNVVNAYAADAVTAADASDAFFVATMAGKTTPEELAHSIGQVAPVAASMKVAMTDLMTAIAASTTVGLDTSSSVAGLRQALINIMHPTKRAREEADRLGIDFTAASLRAKGFTGFLDMITSSANFNADSLGKLFHSVEGLNVMTALAANNGKTYHEFLKLMEDRAGKTDVAFQKMAATLEFQQKRFQGMAENAAIAVGHALEDVKLAVVGFGNSILATFLRLPESVVRIGAQLLAAAGASLAFIGVAMAVKGALLLWPFAVTLAKGALASLWATAAPLIPMLLGFVAAGTLLAGAWRHDFGGLRTTLTQWWNSAKLVFDGVSALLDSDKGGIGTIGKDLYDALMKAGLWPLVQELYVWGGLVLDLFRGVRDGVAFAFDVAHGAARLFLGALNLVLRAIGWVASQVFGSFVPAFDAIAVGSIPARAAVTLLGYAIGFVVFGMIAYRTWAMVTATWAGIVRTAVLFKAAAMWVASAATTTLGGAMGSASASAALLNVSLGAVVGTLFLIVGLVAAAIAYIDELQSSFEDMLDIEPMRWLMKQVGAIPAGASDADIAAAMGTRERAATRRLNERQVSGRDDFVSRLGDNLGITVAPPAGAPTQSDRALSMNMAALAAQFSVPSGVGASGGNPPAAAAPNIPPIVLQLDSDVIHRVVVDKDGRVRQRAGD